jgi:hypothetical protein
MQTRRLWTVGLAAVLALGCFLVTCFSPALAPGAVTVAKTHAERERYDPPDLGALTPTSSNTITLTIDDLARLLEIQAEMAIAMHDRSLDTIDTMAVSDNTADAVTSLGASAERALSMLAACGALVVVVVLAIRKGGGGDAVL